MAALSKYIDEITRGMTCRDITHPDHECLTALPVIFPQLVRGNAKFYIPVTVFRLISLAFSKNSKSVDDFRKLLVDFFGMVGHGVGLCYIYLSLFCLLL
jgi:hypothetical protein